MSELVGVAFLGWIKVCNESSELEKGWAHDPSIARSNLVAGILSSLLELLSNWWKVECVLVGREVTKLLLESLDVNIKSDATVGEVTAWCVRDVEWTILNWLGGWDNILLS